MQRLREQFSRRKQNTIDQPGSEPVTPAKGSAQAGQSPGRTPISDPHPTTSHHYLFRFPSNSSQQQPKSPKKASAHAQKARKQMLKQQAHSLPQSSPAKSSANHPPLAYHESQPDPSSSRKPARSESKEAYFPKEFKENRQTANIPSSSPKTASHLGGHYSSSSVDNPPSAPSNIQNIQSLQQQIHYKRNLMTAQMQQRYQQLPRHQRVNQSFSSSQHMVPSSPLLQAESKYRSASFEEIRNVKENQMIYEEHSIEVEDTNLSLSESNSSSLHNLHGSYQVGLQNATASCCSSSGSINATTFAGTYTGGHPPAAQHSPRQSNIRNPTVFSLASTKSPRSKSFDCCQATQPTLYQQQSLQDKMLTSTASPIGNTGDLSSRGSSNIGLISSTNISNNSNLIKEQQPQQQPQPSTSAPTAVRCSTPQPISNIQAISTASISSVASDSPSKKRGPFLEIPRWRMLIRRTTTSNQLSGQHKNADGTVVQLAGAEFSPPSSAAIDKQTINFERECVHCALISELLKTNRISSRGTSSHTSLSSLEDSDSEQHLIMQPKTNKDGPPHSLSKSADYFDLSSSIKELDTLSQHINKLELESGERFSSQFAKCSSGSSEKSEKSGGSGSGKEVSSSGKETASLRAAGANCDSLEEDYYTGEPVGDLELERTKAQQANETNAANIDDLSKSVSFNDGSCENVAEHTSTSNSRNASLISLPMVTLSLPSSESDDQVTSLTSVGQQSANYPQQASNTGQFHSPPISPPPYLSSQQQHQQLQQQQPPPCCKNKSDESDFDPTNNSSCITVVSLTVPVLAPNKSGRSASVDSSYLKVPQRTDIGTYEAPPRTGQRSKSVDIYQVDTLLHGKFCVRSKASV